MSGLQSWVRHADGWSLLHGMVPTVVQAMALVAVAAAVVVTRRRRRVLAAAVVLGGGLAVGVATWLDRSGLENGPAPATLWWWSGATIAAAVLAVGGRRLLALLAVPLAALATAMSVDAWTGYYPTVGTAWSALTAGPLPDYGEQGDVMALAAHHLVPPTGRLTAVPIGSAASGFVHRTELVWLPPAWFRTTPPPPLPTVLMIGGEFNTPEDWVRMGGAVATADAYAVRHHGEAPVLVFADVDGRFANDTECVDGPRGRVADHLLGDVVPYVAAAFGTGRQGWGVAGFSMGGTCAVDLAVMHPQVFSAFVDIAGDRGPNAGTAQETIARLFGGDAATAAAYDPSTALRRHGPYADLVGWFDVDGDVRGRPGDQLDAARTLCTDARAQGVRCTVSTRPGHHDWTYAGTAFAAALPWLAGTLAPGDLST